MATGPSAVDSWPPGAAAGRGSDVKRGFRRRWHGRDAPRPSPDNARVVVQAPGKGPGFWAGGPSVTRTEEGTFWLAYRLRRPVGEGRGYANVVARSEDGVAFETVSVLGREAFDCDSLERPALVAAGRRDLATVRELCHPRHPPLAGRRPGGRRPARLRRVVGRTVLAGDRHRREGPGGPGARRPWHMWLCCHPLDRPDDTDRMSTRYGTSVTAAPGRCTDVALAGTARAAGTSGAPGWPRCVAPGVLAGLLRRPGHQGGERRGAHRAWPPVDPRGSLVSAGGVVGACPDGAGFVALRVGGGPARRRLRLYYETSRRDGAHDLRTEYVPPSR